MLKAAIEEYEALLSFIEVHKQLELLSESWASNNEDAQVPDCCQIVLIKVFDILVVA